MGEGEQRAWMKEILNSLKALLEHSISFVPFYLLLLECCLLWDCCEISQYLRASRFADRLCSLFCIISI